MKKIMCIVLTLVVLLPLFPIMTQVEVKAAISSYTTTINGQTLPFADYPVGSYFTDNGKACTDHGTCGAGASYTDETACNCKCTWNGVALKSTSCMGFASMVFYRLFGHTIYSQTTKVVSDIPASSINATYLYNLFTNGTVKPGAHIRNSTHSMIFMGCDATYIYTYEGNYDGYCGVGVLRRTWEEMSTYLKNRSGIKYIQMSNTSYTAPETPAASFNGCVDACSGGDGTVYVKGWAYDTSDTAKSIEVHVYIGGSAGVGEGHVLTANTYREDVNGVYNCGDYHGFEGTILTQKYGVHDVYVYAVNSGDNMQLIGTYKTVTIRRGIEGAVDCCIGNQGSIYVGGWALNYDNLNEVLDIHVYIGGKIGEEGTERHIIKADLYREDIENGSFHGFETNISTNKYGTHDVYFYAVKNNGEWEQLNYNPFTVTISRGIEGAVDCCVGDQKSIYVGGWAFDYDNPNEVLDVYVYIRGKTENEETEKHIIKADLYREDIENGSFHGFETSILTNKYGACNVLFYAVNNNTNTQTKIGSAEVEVKNSEAEKSVTRSKVLKSGDLHTVNTTLFNIGGGVLVVAGYKDGKMVDKTSVPCGADMPDAELTGDIDEIRVMVWDALGSFKPVCEMISIPESEFATE